MSGSHGETYALRFARGREKLRHQAYGIVRDASGCECERTLFLASGSEIFWGGQNRARPGGRLRRAHTLVGYGDRKTPGAESWIRAGKMTKKVRSVSDEYSPVAIRTLVILSSFTMTLSDKKLVFARRENQHARRARYPDRCGDACSKRRLPVARK